MQKRVISLVLLAIVISYSIFLLANIASDISTNIIIDAEKSFSPSGRGCDKNNPDDPYGLGCGVYSKLEAPKYNFAALKGIRLGSSAIAAIVLLVIVHHSYKRKSEETLLLTSYWFLVVYFLSQLSVHGYLHVMIPEYSARSIQENYELIHLLIFTCVIGVPSGLYAGLSYILLTGKK